MIKPEFFDDPDVGELSPDAALFFIGLWTQADREGRLVDDVRRLKARIFPYRTVNVDALITELHGKDMVRRYQDDDGCYLWVTKFTKHQRPHPKEPPSLIPPWTQEAVERNGATRKETAGTPESGFLILDSGIRNPPPAGDERDEQFTRFWAVYPAKKGKKAAWQEWRKLRPSDELAEQIIAAVQVQVRWPDWLRDGGQYIPNPSTWLHQGRWDDEPKRGVRQAGGATPMPVSTWECLHDPPCDAGTTAFRCNQRTVLEQGRQKTA